MGMTIPPSPNDQGIRIVGHGVFWPLVTLFRTISSRVTFGHAHPNTQQSDPALWKGVTVSDAVVPCRVESVPDFQGVEESHFDDHSVFDVASGEIGSDPFGSFVYGRKGSAVQPDKPAYCTFRVHSLTLPEEVWCPEDGRVQHVETRLIDLGDRVSLYAHTYTGGRLRVLRLEPEVVEVYRVDVGDYCPTYYQVRFLVFDCSKRHRQVRFAALKSQNQMHHRLWPEPPVTVPIGPILGFESERIRRLPDEDLLVVWSGSRNSNNEERYGYFRQSRWQFSRIHISAAVESDSNGKNPVEEQEKEAVLLDPVAYIASRTRGPPASKGDDQLVKEEASRPVGCP